MNKVEPRLPESSAAPSVEGVSIVIPAYNYAHFLLDAIKSALQQDYPLFEVIVVDDGSKDNTAELVKALCPAHERLRYIFQENQGLPSARNTGIKAARFEYIGFLDADDQWLPGMLSRAMRAFAELPKEFAIVTCRVHCVDVHGNRIAVKQVTPNGPQEWTCRDLLLKSRFAPSAVVARRQALEECGCFDATLRSSEDRDMWVRVAASHRVMHNPERLVLIRRHAGSMSTHTERMKINTRKVLRKAYERGLVSKLDFLFWLQVISFQYFQTAWMYQGEGHRAKALGNVILSMLLWPFFPKPGRLNEPQCFRFRALLLFLRGVSGAENIRNTPANLKSA